MYKESFLSAFLNQFRKTSKKEALKQAAMKKLESQRALSGSAETAAPVKQEFAFEGELRNGRKMICSVNGEDFIITPNTWVVGNLEVGCQVKVKGCTQVGNERYATSIVVSAAPEQEIDRIVHY
jgi:hypothetical protein